MPYPIDPAGHSSPPRVIEIRNAPVTGSSPAGASVLTTLLVAIIAKPFSLSTVATNPTITLSS